jgi:hypothetical protein
MGRQRRRIALARDDGADDRHPGGAGEVGDRAMHLDVHLVEGLLHPLYAARALSHEIGHLALQRPEPDDGVGGPEGSAQQPAAMQQRQPLAIADIGLPPRDVVQLAGVDQDDLDPAGREQLVDGDPNGAHDSSNG